MEWRPTTDGYGSMLLVHNVAARGQPPSHTKPVSWSEPCHTRIVKIRIKKIKSKINLSSSHEPCQSHSSTRYQNYHLAHCVRAVSTILDRKEWEDSLNRPPRKSNSLSPYTTLNMPSPVSLTTNIYIAIWFLQLSSCEHSSALNYIAAAISSPRRFRTRWRRAPNLTGRRDGDAPSASALSRQRPVASYTTEHSCMYPSPLLGKHLQGGRLCPKTLIYLAKRIAVNLLYIIGDEKAQTKPNTTAWHTNSSSGAEEILERQPSHHIPILYNNIKCYRT